MSLSPKRPYARSRKERLFFNARLLLEETNNILMIMMLIFFAFLVYFFGEVSRIIQPWGGCLLMCITQLILFAEEPPLLCLVKKPFFPLS